ncbi:MAG: DUF6769 family protein [Prevotella sp.]
MKKAANIIIPFLALLITIVPAIPHHHHEDAVCMIMERCESDNTFNDEHTAHHGDDKGDDCHVLCIKNIKSLAAKSIILNDGDEVLLLPLLFTLFDELFACTQERDESLCDRYCNLYKSFDGGGLISLRAPPHFLSSTLL